MKTQTLALTLALSLVTALASAAPSHHIQDMKKMDMSKSMMMMKSSPFKGVEVNSGTVTLYKKGNETHLMVSDDFKVPTSPAPHWQVVDGKGNTYLLQRFTIVGDKTNRDIKLPSYVTSVAKVQVWCSFAEVVLGETSFAKPMKSH